MTTVWKKNINYKSSHENNIHIGDELSFSLVFPPPSMCACVHLVNDVTFGQSKGPWLHFCWNALSVVKSIATTAYLLVVMVRKGLGLRRTGIHE